jgi:hypothetical protein
MVNVRLQAPARAECQERYGVARPAPHAAASPEAFTPTASLIKMLKRSANNRQVVGEFATNAS